MINQTQDTRELHNAAIRLWEDGFSVIPLCPRQKRPAVEWTKYQRERCDIIDINRWWPISAGSASSHVLPYGLGIVTGRVSHDVTLDFDPAQGSTVEALLAEAEAHFGSTFPETCRVLTVTYGWHDHYRIGANASVSAVPTRLFFTGKHGKIELRADGAVAVMPPTIAVPKTGMGVVSPGTFRQYTYLRGLDRRLDWESTWMSAAASAAVVAAVGSAAACSGVADLEKPPTQAEIQAAVAMVRPYLTADCVCVLDGSRMCDDRSAQSYWLACELVRTAKSHDLDWSPRVIACVVMAAPCHIEKYGKRHGGWDAWTDAVNCAKKANAGGDGITVTNNDNGVVGTDGGEFEIIPFDQLEPQFRQPQFLIFPLLPRGELTIMDGDDGIGKTWIGTALAAGLTGSKVCPVPYDHTARKDCKVLILTCEDDPLVTIGPRLRELGADLSRVSIIKKHSARFIDGITAVDIQAAYPKIIAHHPDLVIIDHITMYSMTLGKLDTDKANQVSAMLEDLRALAREINCCALLFRHFRKGDGSAKDRGLGSVAFRMRARSHLVVGFDPGDVVMRERRIIKQEKMNLVPRLEEGIVFTIRKGDEPPFQWAGTCEIDADCLTSRAAAERNADAKTKVEMAVEMLLEYLSDDDGSGIEKEFFVKKAKELDVSLVTLRRAKESCGVLSRQEGFGSNKKSFWFLPGKIGKK